MTDVDDTSDIVNSVSDRESLLTIVTIFLVGLSLEKNDDISDIRDILIDDRISDGDRLRGY